MCACLKCLLRLHIEVLLGQGNIRKTWFSSQGASVGKNLGHKTVNYNLTSLNIIKIHGMPPYKVRKLPFPSL